MPWIHGSRFSHPLGVHTHLSGLNVVVIFATTTSLFEFGKPGKQNTAGSACLTCAWYSFVAAWVACRDLNGLV
jgi:hypothetical protein